MTRGLREQPRINDGTVRDDARTPFYVINTKDESYSRNEVPGDTPPSSSSSSSLLLTVKLVNRVDEFRATESFVGKLNGEKRVRRVL